MQKHVLLSLVLVACTSLAVSPPAMQRSESHRAHPFNYPIAFQINAGQVRPEVKFVSQQQNYRLFLTPHDAVFTFSNGASQTARLRRATRRASRSNPDSLRLHLLGASAHANPEGRKTLPSYSNYLIGNDPRKWRTHVPEFAEVWSPAIYPGIDLVYYGNGGRLEYDFVVAPGANPDRIKFSVTRSERPSEVRLNADGDLVVTGPDGAIVLHRPLLYQGKSCSRNSAGSYKNQPGCKAVPGGGFRLQQRARGGALVGLKIPAYDHSQPMIIDPPVAFSTYLGGSSGDGVDSMTLDSNGYIYLYGDTSSADFPVTLGAYQTSLASPPGTGSTDAFVTKLSPDGSQILWSTYLGGSKDEMPKGIALDSANNVWVTGQTWSNDFPVANPLQAQAHSYSTGYVSKLSADGTKLLYSTYLGGSSQDTPDGIVLDTNGEPIVAGFTDSFDFPVVNALQPTHGPGESGDVFVTKFSADGSSLIFSTYLGGPGEDEATGIALDSSQNIYLTGTAGAGFPTTANSFQPTCVSTVPLCSFVAKISASGQSLAYSTYLSDALASGIAVNAAGNAFVTGKADSDFQTTPGAFQTQLGGGGLVKDPDAFVTEMHLTGSSMIYSTFLGGGGSDSGYAIAIDSSNNAYMTGQTDSADFPLQSPVQTTFYGGVPSVFVSELNGTGSALIFSTYWGGGAQGYGSQQGNAIAVDSTGNIIATGSTLVPDFPVVNPIQSQLLGPGDAFITKFEFVPDFAFKGTPSSATVTAGQPANYSLTLTPLNGFNQEISITCSGAPLNSTCSISPATLTLDGTHDGNATVTVATAPRSASMLGSGMGATVIKKRGNWNFVALFGLCFAVSVSTRRSRTSILSALVLIVLVSLFLISCGGGGSNGGGGGGTPPGNYTITVTAKGGNFNHSAKFTLKVN